MYIFGFLVGLIMLIGIIAFPYIMKMTLKIQYFKGMGSGICCVVLCLLCLFGALGLFTFIVFQHMKSLGYRSFSIPFTFTFSQWFHYGYSGYDIEYCYLISYIALNICVFLLIICFVNKSLKNFESNKQIFMLISGFGFGFILPFTLGILLGLDIFDRGKLYDDVKEWGYENLLLCFELFTLSYLLQIAGVILLVFIWLKNSKRLFLFIALGAFFIPFLVLFISLKAKSKFMTDYLTPITFCVALVLGILFYIKNNNNDEVPPPQEENNPLVPAY